MGSTEVRQSSSVQGVLRVEAFGLQLTKLGTHDRGHGRLWALRGLVFGGMWGWAEIGWVGWR